MFTGLTSDCVSCVAAFSLGFTSTLVSSNHSNICVGNKHLVSISYCGFIVIFRFLQERKTSRFLCTLTRGYAGDPEFWTINSAKLWAQAGGFVQKLGAKWVQLWSVRKRKILYVMTYRISFFCASGWVWTNDPMINSSIWQIFADIRWYLNLWIWGKYEEFCDSL